MAKPAVPLTDTKVRKAKAKDAPYRLHDGGGLALLVLPSGVKSWQLRYKLDGKDQTRTLGKLDAITLAQARDMVKELRTRADKGEHLTRAKHAEKAAARAAKRTAEGNTFDALSKSWMTREGRRKQ